ncbi:MAG: VWA domain-containing protein [Campylobacterales bacterium]|nr:VWA domain-containing protein [Campylobacterales bacterium]
MFEGFYFEFPKAALLLLLFLGCAKLCPLRPTTLYFPHLSQFAQASVPAQYWLRLLKWSGIVLLVLTLMSPVRDEQITLDPTEGYDIALVLDLSQSMAAPGFDPANPSANRFDTVRAIVRDFIAQRGNDNLAMVVFGAYSFVASPLTYDKQILGRILDQLYIGMAGKHTALYEGVAQGVGLMQGSKAASRIAIVLTDGHNTPGGRISLDVAVDLAKKEGIKLYPIGIGAPGEYNGEVLMQMAKETGGEAFAAQSAAQLRQIYETIDALEKSKIERESLEYLKYYYMYPLFGAFFALLGYVYLRSKKGW